MACSLHGEDDRTMEEGRVKANGGVVRALQIYYLEPDCFSVKVIFVSEENIHLDLADRATGQAGYDAMEHGPAWHELLCLDVQLLHGIAVQYVDTASAINQNAGESGSSPLRCEGDIQY